MRYEDNRKPYSNDFEDFDRIEPVKAERVMFMVNGLRCHQEGNVVFIQFNRKERQNG